MGDNEEKTPLVVKINEDETDIESFDVPSAPPSSSLGDRQRLKYYYSLQKSHGIKFAVPESFLPPELWVRGINPTPRSSQIFSKEALKRGGEINSPTPAPSDNKQSSLVTIFSIVNTMLGSSLLSIPWAFTQSGFGTGIGTVLFVGIICFYTAYLIVKNSEGEDDFSQICKIYLGQFGYVISIICSILVLVGAAIAYDIIMSHSLYDLVDGIKELATGRDDPSELYKRWWNDHTVPIIIVIVLFPLLNLKEFVVLVKLNTVGILSILYLLFFIPFVSLYKRDIQVTKVAQFEGKFYYLAGIMTLAFFIHNCVVSILKNNRHQKHNARDLSIAYVIVAFTYCLVGASGFLGYGNVPGGMPQDFLKLLATTQPLSLVARAFVVIQLLSVYPLILFIIRLQFFGFFWKKAYPGFFHVLILNTFLAATTTLFAMFFPKIGEVLRFTGAFCGLVYVFVLPIGVHWRKQKQKNKLSAWSIISHSFLLLLGLASLVSQFL